MSVLCHLQLFCFSGRVTRCDLFFKKNLCGKSNSGTDTDLFHFLFFSWYFETQTEGDELNLFLAQFLHHLIKKIISLNSPEQCDKRSLAIRVMIQLQDFLSVIQLPIKWLNFGSKDMEKSVLYYSSTDLENYFCFLVVSLREMLNYYNCHLSTQSNWICDLFPDSFTRSTRFRNARIIARLCFFSGRKFTFTTGSR